MVFAHGSGSSRFSSRNRAVANALNDRRIGHASVRSPHLVVGSARANVFNIDLLAQRLVDAVRFIDREPPLSRLSLGLFGAPTGAAAALAAAARLDERIDAIVSRGGRPDLAGDVLDPIRTPTLLIVGGADFGVIELNEQALARRPGPKALEIVPGATHLFPEPGASGEVVIEHATGGSSATFSG